MDLSSSGCLVSDIISPTQCYLLGERIQDQAECFEFENNQNDLVFTQSDNNKLGRMADFNGFTSQQRLDQLLLEEEDEDCDVVHQGNSHHINAIGG